VGRIAPPFYLFLLGIEKMIKNSNIGDIVAAEMDKTLETDEFKKIFASPVVETAKPDYSEALSEDSNYRAFVRFASKKENEDEEDEDKKDEKDDDEKEDKKPKKGKQPPWLKGKGKGKDDDEDECGAFAGAMNHLVETFVRTSEALEGMGLKASARKSIMLLDDIIKEAAAIKKAQFAEEFGTEEPEDVEEESLEEEIGEPPPVGEEDEELSSRLDELTEPEETLEVSDADDFVMDDPEVIAAFKELNEWVKTAESDDDEEKDEDKEKDEKDEDEKDEEEEDENDAKDKKEDKEEDKKEKDEDEEKEDKSDEEEDENDLSWLME